MDVTAQMLWIVLPLIFLASAIDAIGGGGGLISLPAYLLAGLPPAMAAGTNKFSASLGTLVATIRYLMSGKLLWKPSLIAVVGALPGAYLGAELVKRTPEQLYQIILLVVVPLMALLLVLRRDPGDTSKPLTAKRMAICFAIGLSCGGYDGFFGPGTGTLLIMGLTWCVGMDMVTASGSAKLVNLASNVAALASLLQGGYVLFGLAIPAAACSVVGGYLGSWLAIRRGVRFIRFVMMGVMALLLITLAIRFFG